MATNNRPPISPSQAYVELERREAKRNSATPELEKHLAELDAQREREFENRQMQGFDQMPATWDNATKQKHANIRMALLQGAGMVQRGKLKPIALRQLEDAVRDEQISDLGNDMDMYVAMRGKARNPQNGALYDVGPCQISAIQDASHKDDDPGGPHENMKKVQGTAREISLDLLYQLNKSGQIDDAEYGRRIIEQNLRPELIDKKTGAPLADPATIGAGTFVENFQRDAGCEQDYRLEEALREDRDAAQAKAEANDPVLAARRKSEADMRLDPKAIEEFNNRNPDPLMRTHQRRLEAQLEQIEDAKKESERLEAANKAERTRVEKRVGELDQRLKHITTPTSREEAERLVTANLGSILNDALSATATGPATLAETLEAPDAVPASGNPNLNQSHNQ